MVNWMNLLAHKPVFIRCVSVWIVAPFLNPSYNPPLTKGRMNVPSLLSPEGIPLGEGTTGKVKNGAPIQTEPLPYS